MNQATFIGHIGKDAEIRNVNGVFAIGFNLGINESYKDQAGNKVDKTLWVSCTIWKSKSEHTGIAQYLTKGTKVLVQGEVSPDVYKNKDGIYMPQLRIRVQRVELLSKKEESQATTQQQPAMQATPSSAGIAEEVDNDLPF